LPARTIPPGTVLKLARNALGLSVEEVAEALTILAIKIERLENNHAHTTYATLMDVQRHYESLGLGLVYDDHGDVAYFRMPDGSHKYLSEAETGVPRKAPPRPGQDPWEQRIVRTSWGYWIRPRNE